MNFFEIFFSSIVPYFSMSILKIIVSVQKNMSKNLLYTIKELYAYNNINNRNT